MCVCSLRQLEWEKRSNPPFTNASSIRPILSLYNHWEIELHLGTRGAWTWRVLVDTMITCFYPLLYTFKTSTWSYPVGHEIDFYGIYSKHSYVQKRTHFFMSPKTDVTSKSIITFLKVNHQTLRAEQSPFLARCDSRVSFASSNMPKWYRQHVKWSIQSVIASSTEQIRGVDSELNPFFQVLGIWDPVGKANYLSKTRYYSIWIARLDFYITKSMELTLISALAYSIVCSTFEWQPSL